MKAIVMPDPISLTQEYEALFNRLCDTAEDLRALNLALNNLNMKVLDACKRARIAYSCNTKDETAIKNNEFASKVIIPIFSRHSSQIGKKIIHHLKFDEVKNDFPVYYKKMKSGLDLYRDENIPLRVEEEKLMSEYSAIMGSLMVDYRGEKISYQGLGKYLESSNRAEREDAFVAREKAFLSVSPKLDHLFSQMLKLRHQKALNANHKNFRDYQFQNYERFDYKEKECLEFHDAIEKLIIPIMKDLNNEKIKKLGLPTLRPWDVRASSDANAKNPFESPNQLLQGCREIFKKMDPELSSYFEDMIAKNTLDLEVREGKAGGGFCSDLPLDNSSFIFMNTTGTRQDIEVLIHESGHAFHNFLAAANVPLYGNRHSGSEFAEVASMSMELLARPFLDQFYSKEDLPLVLKEQIARALDLFPLIAKIDAFQHWVYTSGPNESYVDDPLLWRKKWIELDQRFDPYIDWSGHERFRETGWQYLHVFNYPFYFIDYGIAQVGAFTVWSNSLKDYEGTVASYKKALKLGGSKSLPELFETVGAKFGLDEKTLRPVLETLKSHL